MNRVDRQPQNHFPTRTIAGDMRPFRNKNSQSCGPAATAALLQSDDRWFESTQDYFWQRLDTPTGRATRPRVSFTGRVFAGSTPALGTDEYGSVGNWQTTLVQNQGCCGFKSHLSYSKYLSSWSSGVLACLSRKRPWVQIPSGTLKKLVRYANRHSGEAQTFVIVGSTPSRTTGKHASVGHRQAQLSVTQPPAGFAGSTPARRTQTPCRWAGAQLALIRLEAWFDSRICNSLAGYANRQSDEVESLMMLWVRRPPRSPNSISQMEFN